ncbi:MAG: alpha/beta fold hydrolase [Spirochaetales bacterium]|nr:alpha/beta fold hydrolase [Spirochaetales bacterium]
MKDLLPDVRNDPPLHFAQTGKDADVLLIHGTPSSGFEWRKVIPHLSGYRVTLPDHLGFGKSPQPLNADYSPEAHAARLIRFVKEQNLRDVHLVLHDYGGPIGLGMALQLPEHIRSICLINTWGFPLRVLPDVRRGAAVMNSFLGRWLYRYYHFSVRFFLKNSFYSKANLPEDVYQTYLQVHDTPEKRMILYALAKAMTLSDSFSQAIWEERSTLKRWPLQIIWGMADPFLPAKELLPIWKEGLPEAAVVELQKSGHFPQEEQPEELARALLHFWEQTPTRSSSK